MPKPSPSDGFDTLVPADPLDIAKVERVSAPSTGEVAHASVPSPAAETPRGEAVTPRLPSTFFKDVLPEKLGRYRIQKLLGRGGMGAVYLAHDDQLDRLVALKIPHFGPDDDPDIRERFFREARLAATLNHPNLCPIYDVGDFQGIPFMTMAFIEGRSLADLLRSTPLPMKEVIRIVLALAKALEEAHRNNILHRDLKPANVMIDSRAQPILMDFGLARKKESSAGLTHTGQILGTPAYMSPEQASRPSAELGPSCDIYSLGAILYEMTTGKPPFEGSVANVFARLLTEEPVRPRTLRPDLDPRLEGIILKAMARQVKKRYASMREFGNALANYLPADEAPTPSFPHLSSAKPAARSFSWLPLIALVASGVVVGALAWNFWPDKKTPSQTASTPSVALASSAEESKPVSLHPKDSLPTHKTPDAPLAKKLAFQQITANIPPTLPPKTPLVEKETSPKTAPVEPANTRVAEKAHVEKKDPPKTPPVSTTDTQPAEKAHVEKKAPPKTPPVEPADTRVAEKTNVAKEDSATTPPLEPADNKLAEKARAVLEVNCHRCHGKDNSAEGGFSFVLDVPQLIARKKIVPGEPAKSKLFKKVSTDEMPPEDENPRPKPQDVAILKRWIEAGAPPFAEVVKERPFLDQKYLLTAIRDRLQKTASSDRPYQRYFTLLHLHNNKTITDRDLQTTRVALAKLANSLSWKFDVAVPNAVDPAKTIYQVDVRDLGWDQPVLWNEILKVYPYGLQFDNDRDESIRELARQVTTFSGNCDLPYVRADWFIATASRPPLYHTLLHLPQHAYQLEKQLEVDVEEDFLHNKLARAGFPKSGVSRQNRLVDRHSARYGAYWKSYDFRASEGTANINQFPLGPRFTANPFPRQAFDHAGGEIIFNLPNGLQAYLLVDAKGKRIDEGPIDIVSDGNQTSGTPTIVNGLSCMSCHRQGLLDFQDTIRQGMALDGDAREKAEQLLTERDKMQKLVEKDRERFLQALGRATGEPAEKTKPADDTGTSEPVGRVARRFLADLSAREAALELGLPEGKSLENRIRGNRELEKLGLSPLAESGSIKRETWESLKKRKTSTFQEAASQLGLGIPIWFFDL